MPRSRTSSPARSAPARSSAPAPAPAPKPSPPAVAPQSSAPAMSSPMGGGGGIMSTIAQGMQWGVGTAIANRAVDAVMGPRTMNVEHTNAPAPAAAASMAPAGVMQSSSSQQQCAEQYNNFQDCLKTSGGNVGQCQFYFDMLSQCQKGSM